MHYLVYDKLIHLQVLENTFKYKFFNETINLGNNEEK